ncbi:MAG: hypothetical protein WD278_10580 [Pirellulales bacterium]
MEAPIHQHDSLPAPRLSSSLVACLLAALAASSGCSLLSGFGRDWRACACHCSQRGSPAGCWEGCWESHCTGHNGKLKAIISRQGEDSYCARFHGTFFKLLPFEYSVRLNAYAEGDHYRLQGSKDLGRLAGGVYRFEGQADGQDFVARYTSSKDSGTFRMSRSGGAGAGSAHGGY